MSISLNVKMSGLQELRAELAGFSDRRLRAAAATGLTRTAKRLAGDWQKEINTKIDQLEGQLRKACPDLPDEAKTTVQQVIAAARNEWIRATSTLVADTVDAMLAAQEPDEDDQPAGFEEDATA